MKKIETKPIFKIGDIIRHKKHGDKYRFTILKVLKDGYVVDDQLLITFNMADNWEVVESEDEKIRKDCISIIKAWETQCKLDGDICEVAPACIAWLEKQKPMEWSQEDLICLGYLADFVDKNGDAFYGKNKPTVVKWIRSFAELPTHTPIKDIEQKPVNKPYPETLEKAIELYYSTYGNGNGGFDNLSLEKFKDIVKTFVEDYSKQKPVEWGEEEKARIERITSFVWNNRKGDTSEIYQQEQDIAWLKSLRPQSNMIQWKGDNLKEVISFTGKSPKFNEWFKSWDDFEKYVHSHNNILKIFCEDGSHYEVPVGAWIVKSPYGYNVPSKGRFISKSAEWSEEDRNKIADYLYCLNVGFTQASAKERAKDICDILRPQKQWKPNGDQIDALYDMIRSFKKESSYSNREDVANIVETLLEQLKAL